MTGHENASLKWAGRLALGPGWAMFSGTAGDNHNHRHLALQLAIGDGEAVRADVDGHRIEAPGLLIAPLFVHRLQSGPVWLLYVDRESAMGRRLAASCEKGVRRLSTEECAVLWAQREASRDTQAIVESVVETLAPKSNRTPVDTASVRRVREVIRSVPQRPISLWRLQDLALEAALSPSRFAHVFRDLTGMAIRPYLRWLRLTRAVEAAARGDSVTDAAHVAGFADAAHFTRTMRHHFGVTPGNVLTSAREHLEPN